MTWTNFGAPIVVDQLVEDYVWNVPTDLIPNGIDPKASFLKLNVSPSN